MSLEEKYKQQYVIGFPIFESFFNLKKESLIECLKDIFIDKHSIMEILDNNPSITKIIKDDSPDSILISFYSKLEINYVGIYHQPEHGECEKIIKFDKFFNRDSITQYQ